MIKLDWKLIKKAESFEKKCAKFGVTFKPEYTLKQPFEITMTKLNNKIYRYK